MHSHGTILCYCLYEVIRRIVSTRGERSAEIRSGSRRALRTALPGPVARRALKMSHAAWTHNTQTVFNKGAQLAYYERRAAGTVDRQRDEDPLEWTLEAHSAGLLLRSRLARLVFE